MELIKVKLELLSQNKDVTTLHKTIKDVIKEFVYISFTFITDN